MTKLKQTAVQSLALDSSLAEDSDTATFYFPEDDFRLAPLLEGYVSVCVKLTTTSGDTDGVTITVAPLDFKDGAYVTAANYVTLVADLNWDTTATYKYAIQDVTTPSISFGPTFGYAVTVTIAQTAVCTAEVWLSFQ